MAKNKALWATLAAVAAVGGGIGASIATSGNHSASTGTDAMPGMTHGGTGTTATTGGSSHASTLSDQEFISRMIPHHESAVVMAKVALKRGQHKEVGRLAQGIVDAQQSEIAQMRGWYRKWFGREVPVMDHMGAAAMAAMGMGSDMASLATAKPFDKAFLSMMIPHHAGAIVMANQVLNSKRPEIRKLGEQIIAAQAKEIGQMQNWRVAWYPPLG